MEAREFFKSVFGHGVGRAVIVLPNALGKPTINRWFQYPDELDDMVELVESRQYGDVWYSPILFKSDERKKDNAKETWVLAADADTCDPSLFRIFPNLIVETSEGRYQVYWSLEGPSDPHEAAKVNRRIAQVHKDEGCDTAFVNAAKLMRVPGTSNNKHLGEVVIVADYDADRWFLFEELEKVYPSDEVPDMIEARLSDMPEGLEEYVNNTNLSELLTGMKDNVEIRSMVYNTSYNEERRSEVLFKLCCLLFEEGLDEKTVAAIAWHAPSNKFRTEDPRGLKGLWETAIAKAKAAVEAGGQEVEYEDASNETRTKTEYRYSKQREPTQFLTLDELERISYEPTFIDEWVQWASSKSDAPKQYHEAAAMILLSTVYSQFGYVLPSFGELKLNLWITVLGRSTKDRKSTSKSYIERMLRSITTEEFSYLLPDDSTPGGLNLALQDRPNKSSLITRDEAQGFFEEMLHQSYMAGGLSYFTKLYDGWSGGRARASGDKKLLQSVPVSFVFYLLGILDDSAETLTIRNFKQGFLTRFLYVVAERPADYVEPPIKFLEEDKKEEDDEVFKSLKRQLEVSRNYWAMLGDDDLSKISISPEAQERFRKFRDDVVAEVNDTKYQEIIDSTSDRMTLSILKLAALLAMHDRKQRIEEIHMLQAIAYAGEFFDNSVLVASMISESEWQRDVEKLEEFISSKGGSVSMTRAYQEFSDKRPKDFEEMVQALESRGLIRRTRMGSRWQLESSYDE